MADINFDDAFKALTDNAPFPWQRALYERFTADRKDNIPESCNLPTGLGKTSVIAVWLIALATHPTKMPRRLVYVVNRRTVVDQTTDEVVKIRERLPKAPQIQDALWELCAVSPDKPDPENDRPLAISTLRGQFADNREWSADPSRPAVICGTVDMIGSRLLFSGYGCGFKTRPLHAGFLGQDALIVHDEAHLEPAFQELLMAIKKEQHEGRTPDFRPLKVMELTATSRSGGEVFGLSDADYKNDTVQKRIGAKKALHLHENKDEKKLADEIADLALKYKDSGRAILVFVRKVEDVEKITKKLPERSFEKLTGTLRGLERDNLVNTRVFQRFLPKAEQKNETVYLVCTSAGEVGVNISADHLICDLSTFESMAQRFGRVNRFGSWPDTEIHVICPKAFANGDKFAPRLKLTLGLLELLNGDASPSALTALRDLAIKEGSSAQPPSSDCVQALRDYVNANQGADPRLGGFAPQPIMLPTSDILFDAWALTTVHELPGRPPVAEYLHGVEDEKNRETHVAWREEVNLFSGTGVNESQIAELLDTFSLKPHEKLRDSTWRVQDELSALSGARADLSVWVIDPDDEVRVLEFGELAKRDNKKKYIQNLIGCTVVLPPSAGGLTSTGTLDSKADRDSERKYDVAGSVQLASGVPLVRLKVTLREGELVYELVAPVRELGTEFVRLPENVSRWEEARIIRTRCREVGLPPMRIAYRLDLRTSEDDLDGLLEYLVLKPESGKKLERNEKAWPSLDGHLAGVKGIAEVISLHLGLVPDIANAACLSAEWHDLGKDRGVWQRGAGNTRDAAPVAKTLHGRPPENLNGFRHELASLVDVKFDPSRSVTFLEQTPACRELLLHLIATHHGRGRPHFPLKEATDPERPNTAAQSIVAETPQRFARLQREYGRWGLAYLESLLRAADALDSQRIEDTPIGDREPGTWPRPVPTGVAWSLTRAPASPTISVNVDSRNPGQFFACCGLLELADRLWPGAEGWFADGQFHVTCAGTLEALTASCTFRCRASRR